MNLLSLLLLIPLALAALTWGLRVAPRRRLVFWALVPCAFSLALVASDSLLPWLIGLDILWFLPPLADLLTLPRRRIFEAERDMLRVASLRKPHSVKITVSNRARRTMNVAIRDDLPELCAVVPPQFQTRLAPQSRSTFNYQLNASRRGAFQLQAVYVRVLSRLKFWQRDLTYPVENALHVYPDMRQMSEYAILARSNRLSLLGVRRARRIGQDNEFERLRDYTLDDNYKYIDWRSTARRGKLTVKDFQVNQSQRVIFLIDCGRMMTNTSGGISLLDHALNAALMLSYVALRKGDSVGLLCFADEIQRYVPPRGGMNQMNRLLHASFDRFPRLVESRYDQAFVYLNSKCRKRSLVVLITNVIDEVNSNQVGQYLASLVGKHLPLGVLMRDHAIFDAAAVPVTGDESLFRVAAAQQIVAWRRSVLADLQSQGVLSLDVFPESLTAPLINSYLDIKARHLL